MGVAYSRKPIITRTLRADTVPHLLTDLDAVLVAANWPRTVITDGYEYALISPQGFQAKLRLTDLGDTSPFTSAGLLTLQVTSADGTVLGQVHKLATGPTAYVDAGYEAVAGCCQLWIALQGITDAHPGGVYLGAPEFSFACGIPYVQAPVTPACEMTAGPASTSEIWWSSGRDHPASNLTDFRSSRYCSQPYSYCLNGVVRVRGNGDSIYLGPLQLYPLTLTEDADFFFFIQPQTVKYSSGDPLYVTPFVGWEFAIRGQLWDAFLATKDFPVDTTKTTVELDAAGNTMTCNWLAWNYSYQGAGNGGTWYATLFLLTTTSVAGLWNYAY
jgi:hypothetical protein